MLVYGLWSLFHASCCSQLWVRHMFCGRDLWWTIPLHIFHWSCLDNLWIPNNHMDLCQTLCVQVPVFSPHWGHMVNLDQSQTSLHKFSVPAGRPSSLVCLKRPSCAEEELKSMANYTQRHHWTVKVCPKGTLILGKVRYLKFGCDNAHFMAQFTFKPGDFASRNFVTRASVKTHGFEVLRYQEGSVCGGPKFCGGVWGGEPNFLRGQDGEAIFSMGQRGSPKSAWWFMGGLKFVWHYFFRREYLILTCLACLYPQS